MIRSTRRLYTPPVVPSAIERKNNGPQDGKAHLNPLLTPLIKVGGRAVSNLMFRKNVTGLENLPEGEGHLYCPTHQSELDLPMVSSVIPEDLRYMTNEKVFWGLPGKVMGNTGYFPVDKENGKAALVYSKDLLESGKSVLMCPEGTFNREGQVLDLKNGVAWLACKADVENVVPVTMNFFEGDARFASKKEKALGWTAAVAVAGACVVAALSGGPAQAIASGFAGALAGGLVASQLSDGGDAVAQAKTLGVGAAVGMALGIGGALSLPPGAGTLLSVGMAALAGVATKSTANAHQARPMVDVEIGKPLKPSEYREKFGKEAGTYLRNDLQHILSRTKSKQNGIPAREPVLPLSPEVQRSY